MALAINEKLDPQLEGLEPAPVWRNFDQLRQIPRPSGKEAQAQSWLMQWASARGFESGQDKKGNVCIKVPASKGYEGAPVVCLQGHADMVPEKTKDSNHNFETDPIQIRRDGDLLKSDGTTTLGADNGIGLAAALAIAEDKSAVHPPLEILVTVEEETGFDGVFNLDAEALAMKSSIVLNLDNEELGDVCVSSAGVQMLNATRNIERVAVDEMGEGSFHKISIVNMPGGHSGVDIDKNRGNAVVLMALLLNHLPPGTGLISLDGGSKNNAIPASAETVVFVRPDDLEKVMKVVGEFKETLPKREAADKKADIKVELADPSTVRLTAMTALTRRAVIHSLMELPNGITEMNPDVDNLVRTSCNLGVAKSGDDKMLIELAARSDMLARMEDIAAQAKGVLDKYQYETTMPQTIPGWDGDPNSPVVQLLDKAYGIVTSGKRTRPVGIHAGIEVGVLVNKLQDQVGHAVEAASFGPDIKSPHSVDEHVKISSVATFYAQLKEVLALIV